MHPPYLSLLLLLLSSLSISSPVPKDSIPFPISTQTSTLSRIRTSAKTSSKWLCPQQQVGQVGIYDIYADQAYATNITIGTQEFLLIIDTGSSDTWVAETGFTCYNGSLNATIPEAECGFASTFTIDSSFQEIPDENFRLRYVSARPCAEVPVDCSCVTPHHISTLSDLSHFPGPDRLNRLI